MAGLSTAETTLSKARPLSTLVKLALLGRVAARQVGKTQMARALSAALLSAASSLARVAHQLWLQITGVLFVAFAVVGSLAFVREYHAWAAGKFGPGRALLAGGFALLFAWFGVSSFWRARK